MTRTRLRKPLVLCLTAATALAVASAASAWTVSMTAQTSLKRTYSWKIEKSVSQAAVTLAPGATADVSYAVTVTPTGSVDSDWAVSGKVTMQEALFEPSPPIINSVIVTIHPDELAASVTCVPSPFPVDLGDSSLVCDYASALPNPFGVRDAHMRAQQLNGNFRNAHTAFDFSNATVNLVDESVAVTDTIAGSLGTVNAADGPKTFTYTKTIGPYTDAQCGHRTVENTASFLTNDSGATGDADADVDVTVTCLPPPPPPGCTHTIGYWKTHAGFGPQPDVVTALLPIWLGTAGGAKSINVLTAAQSTSLLKMEGSNGVKASSNGINKLYAQLLGAKLSGADGADGSVIASVIAAADAFLANNNSLSWSGLTKAQQATVNGWMTSLDNYNNGLLGVAHCG